MAVAMSLRVPRLGCLLSAAVLLVASSEEQNQVSIQQGQPAEEPIAKAGHGNALRLNAQTFVGNVFTTELTEHWVVGFCPNWWEPCQNLQLPFDQMSLDWERKLNTALLSKTVRFAVVDCATDKVLCNEQEVEQYPTVHHYHKGKRVASWRGGRKNDAEQLAKFLTKQLAKRVVTEPEEPAEGLAQQLLPGDHAIDLCLVLFVLSVNIWAVFSNTSLWQKPTEAALEEPCVEAVQAPEASSMESASNVKSVERFLPQEWNVDRNGIDL